VIDMVLELQALEVPATEAVMPSSTISNSCGG